MTDWGIQFRDSPTVPPFLSRTRKSHRQAFLDILVDNYRIDRSTARLAAVYGGTQMTVQR
jgi:hypothetical protein